MLRILRIKNFVTVDELEIEFGPGLNILTGETGAGKSVIFKAIDLLTGKRATAENIRNGCDSCAIEGLFELEKTISGLEECPDEIQELLSESEILVKRLIDQSGKSKIYINGSLVTASTLQNLAPLIIDITSQHQQQNLLNPKYHLSFLDSYGTDESLLSQVASAFNHYSHAKHQLNSVTANKEQQENILAKLQQEFDELAQANLRIGARVEYEAELSKLAHVETLTNNINNCLNILDDTETESSIDSQLRALSTIIAHSEKIDPALNNISTVLESAFAQINEIKILLSEYGASLEIEPSRIEYLREQIAEIARLERKYSKKENELVEYFEKISLEIKNIQSGAFDIKKLEQELALAEFALRELEIKLTLSRKGLSKKLETEIKKGLAQLKMKDAVFSVEITSRSSSATGADNVEFTLSTNPGEPQRALSKVASGGELSRILLILKTVLNENNSALTQIFDEVDTGIGGAVSQIVGEKLTKVAKNSQVIIITHSPQVAAFADRHYLISKKVKSNKAFTTVDILNEDSRVSHLASMIGGKEKSKSFEVSALELINASKRS